VSELSVQHRIGS